MMCLFVIVSVRVLLDGLKDETKFHLKTGGDKKKGKG